MLRIYRVLRVRSSKGELAVKALFDTGAPFTVVRRDVAEKIGHILPTDVREVTLANGKTKLKVLGYIPISTPSSFTYVVNMPYMIKCR
jgi:predicted aspartyl protease